MPEPDLFARGFSIQEGATLAGHRITESSIQENAVVRYHHYVYVCRLFIDSLSDPNSVINALNSMAPRIVHSSHGTPYSCSVNLSSYRKQGRGYVFIVNGEAFKESDGVDHGVKRSSSYQVNNSRDRF
jgi:hypothetical protein